MHINTFSPFQMTWYPRALGLLRSVTGYLLIAHGTSKHLGFPSIPAMASLPPGSLPWIAGLLELGGGVLILLGLFTRPAAFILSGMMAFAYFIGHASRGNPLLPILNGGELAVVYCFLFMSVAGGGEWSLDSILRRRR